jgi:uncharacterized protein YkwD
MEEWFMKKILLTLALSLLLASLTLAPVLSAAAAPRTMSDGTIFDPEFYAKNNPDVVKVFGKKTSALYKHYTKYGKAEGRAPYEGADTAKKSSGKMATLDEFDASFYAKNNPDVVKVYGKTKKRLYAHYKEYGFKEGRPAYAGQVTTKEAAKETAKPKAAEEAPVPSSGNTLADDIVRLTNEERANAGLSALTADNATLTQAAMIRAQEIMVSFSHTRPNGKDPNTAYTELGGTYKRFGENLAMGQKTPQQAVTAWMNSQGHKDNMLYTDYKPLGVGVAVDSKGYYYWVQLFVQ